MNRIISSELLSDILARTRCECGQTQKYMARAMGKSIGTIQNWECGTATPNMIDTMEWFNVLGLNPLRYALDFFYPDTYKEVRTSSSDDEIKEVLLHYISEVASPGEIRKLSYCIFGNTGSSWNSQLNMMCAHNHTTMKSRVTVAQAIMDNYDMEKYRGELIHPDHIMCDEENLRAAIASGKQAVFEGNSGYIGKMK